MRVVSVLPSATEIVCALGHGAELVGRSSECDYPPEVQRLPAVMHPRTWDAERSSREIDERVRGSRARGESLYELDVGRLASLRPDLLITQDLCGVCSVTEEEVASACARAGIRPNVLSLSPTNLEQVWSSVETVGAALGDRETGTSLARSLRERARAAPAKGATVAVVEWLDPPILAGLWTPDVVRAAGGTPLGPKPSEPGTRTTWAELSRSAPDLLVLSPCSFSVARSNRELEDTALRSRVLSLRPRLGTFVADEAYFSRPGPRLIAGVELIRTLLTGTPPRGPMPVEALSPMPPHVSA